MAKSEVVTTLAEAVGNVSVCVCVCLLASVRSRHVEEH